MFVVRGVYGFFIDVVGFGRVFREEIGTDLFC